MHFSFDFQTDHLKQILEATRREIATPQEMLGSVGDALLRVNNRRHEQGLAPDGTKWKPLAPLTIGGEAWKKQSDGERKSKTVSIAGARKAASRRILYQNGDLLRFHYQVNGDTMNLGTNDRKAVWHHSGTGTHGPTGKPYVIKPVNKKALGFAGLVVKRVNHPGIPARPLVGYPESDERLVGSVLTDHLTAVLNRVR